MTPSTRSGLQTVEQQQQPVRTAIHHYRKLRNRGLPRRQCMRWARALWLTGKTL